MQSDGGGFARMKGFVQKAIPRYQVRVGWPSGCTMQEERACSHEQAINEFN